MRLELLPRLAFEQAREEMRIGKVALAGQRTYRRLKVLADECDVTVPDKACRPGCSFCCREPIAISECEAAAIALWADTKLSKEAKEVVAARTEQYRHRRRREERDLPCPFLNEGLCQIYEVRPFLCRGAASSEADVCRRRVSNWDLERLNGALGHGVSLEIAQAASAAVSGQPALLELGLIAPTLLQPLDRHTPISESTSERRLPKANPSEPQGWLEPTPPEVAAYTELVYLGDFQRQQLALKGLHPTVRRILGLRVPQAYESQGQLEESREQFASAMSELESVEVDPAEAFNSLAYTENFELAYQGLSVRQLNERYGTWLEQRVVRPLLSELLEPLPSRKPGKPRIGYLSANLWNSNASIWAVPWMQAHGDRFETFAFNLGRTQDSGTWHWMLHADHYHQLVGPVAPCARFIRELDLDVLIYTDIGMNGRSRQFAALRLARTQCTAWGHPVTSGMPQIDYYLSSDWMEPEGAQSEYTERLVRLPDAGHLFEKVQRASTPAGAPNLPSGPFVLMAQNPAKCVPKWDSLLASVSERTGSPIVCMSYKRSLIAERTAMRFRKAGINAIWLPTLSRAEYLAVLARASVSIDPPAWSGGNTTVDAISLGTPVVTFPEPMMRARHSLAFLRKAGLERLVALNESDYVDNICQCLESKAPFPRADDLFERQGVAQALNEFVLSRAR